MDKYIAEQLKFQSDIRIKLMQNGISSQKALDIACEIFGELMDTTIER